MASLTKFSEAMSSSLRADAVFHCRWPQQFADQLHRSGGTYDCFSSAHSVSEVSFKVGYPQETRSRQHGNPTQVPPHCLRSSSDCNFLFYASNAVRRNDARCQPSMYL